MNSTISTGVTKRAAVNEGFSAWWWLAMPIAVAVLLAVVETLSPALYETYINSEQGVLEGSHVVIPLAGLVIALRILALRATRAQPLLFGWVALGAVACFYIAGEEASWGQHFLDWSTPDRWQEINDQQETNLHNVSSWLDQKPRLLLELGVIVGGIVVPIAALLRPALRQGHLAVILPPLLCLPVAVLAEVSRLSERLADLTQSEPLLYARASEVQELFFYLFILFYMIVLNQRLTRPAPD
jgi:hypothetical protein